MTELILKHQTEEDIQHLAKAMAEAITCPTVILLFGDLGAGKSTFARFLIKALTHEDMIVPSPTFTLLQSYDTKKGPLTHFDLYRLSNAEEVFELGWDEYIQNHICLVEWPERLENHYPTPHIHIHLKEEDETRRHLSIMFQPMNDVDAIHTALKRFLAASLLNNPF